VYCVRVCIASMFETTTVAVRQWPHKKVQPGMPSVTVAGAVRGGGRGFIWAGLGLRG